MFSRIISTAFFLLAFNFFFLTPRIGAETISSGTQKFSQETSAEEDLKAVNLPRVETGYWLPQNISTFGGKVDSLFYSILALTCVIFWGVQGALFYFIFKYRAGIHPRGVYVQGNQAAEIIWTLIPALILTVLAFSSQHLWKDIKRVPPDTADTVKIRVQAEQYAWNIQYPGADEIFDTADDIKNINQMHIPVGKSVRVTLTSVEKEGKPAVIHSFFLPEFRLKQDVVPGMAIDVWFQAMRTGKFEIACSEFCGLGHYRMKGFLTIHTPEGYNAWLKEQESIA